MSETLLIHFDIDKAQQASWALCNIAGELTGKITTGSLDEAGELAASHPVVILLNSHCLHINQLQLPTQNQQKILKAIPYAIEEYIADDIENFHFVASRNRHNDFTAIAGIEESTLKKIIDTFQQAGIFVEKIIPDALCLPASEKQWVCLNFHNDSYLQTDVLNGMVYSNDVLPYVLNSMLQDEALVKPEKLLLFSEQDNTSVFEQLETQSHADNQDIEFVRVVYNNHPLVVFCGHYKQALPLNLLQGKFKAKRKTSGYWQHWRIAATLAAAWLILHLGLTAFQLSQLKQQNAIAKAKIEKIYRKAFPQSKKIVNPRVQMEQKLKALKGNTGSSDNGLLFLLAESFGSLAYDKQNITMQSLTYRNNRMDIGLDSKNLQAIENLNKNLNSNPKIKSEITASSSEKDRVSGHLRIEARN